MRSFNALGLVLLALAACSSRSSSRDSFRLEARRLTLVGDRPGTNIVSVEAGTRCIARPEASCVPVEPKGDFCVKHEGAIDVLVVGDAQVAAVCYPGPNRPRTEVGREASGHLEIAEDEALVTFPVPDDADAGGYTYRGNVKVTGDDVTLWGNGADKTVIEGDLILDGKRARVRGLRVTGNVLLNESQGAVVLSWVEGDLNASADGTLVADTVVMKNANLHGASPTLVGNAITGQWNVEGQGALVCSENTTFASTGSNYSVEPGEVSGDLCALLPKR